MRRTYERGTKATLSFSGGPHAPVNMAEYGSECRWKNEGNGTFAALYCAIFRTPSLSKSLKFFGTHIATLDPETVQLPAFSTLSAMFTGACGPPVKLSLALVPRSYVLRITVKLSCRMLN